jgi:hypothetical protein
MAQDGIREWALCERNNEMNSIAFLFTYLFLMTFSTAQMMMNAAGHSCGQYVYHPNIRIEGLWKTTTNVHQGNRSPSRDLNVEPPKYVAGVIIHQRSSRMFYESTGMFHGRRQANRTSY